MQILKIKALCSKPCFSKKSVFFIFKLSISFQKMDKNKCPKPKNFLEIWKIFSRFLYIILKLLKEKNKETRNILFN